MARTARAGEYSEGEGLSRIIGLAEQVRSTVRAYTAIKGVQTDAMSHAAALLSELMGTARSLLGQVAKGVHTNPGLVVYGLANPPKGGALMSKRVYAVEYKHADDGGDYRHDCQAGVSMWALGDGAILLRRPDGKSLSRDF